MLFEKTSSHRPLILCGFLSAVNVASLNTIRRPGAGMEWTDDDERKGGLKFNSGFRTNARTGGGEGQRGRSDFSETLSRSTKSL